MFNLGKAYMYVLLGRYLYKFITDLYYIFVGILTQINYVMIYAGLMNSVLIISLKEYLWKNTRKIDDNIINHYHSSDAYNTQNIDCCSMNYKQLMIMDKK